MQTFYVLPAYITIQKKNMLTAELINKNIPRLQLQDTVGKALQLINDFRVSHLPVVNSDNEQVNDFFNYNFIQ